MEDETNTNENNDQSQASLSSDTRSESGEITINPEKGILDIYEWTEIYICPNGI